MASSIRSAEPGPGPCRRHRAANSASSAAGIERSLELRVTTRSDSTGSSSSSIPATSLSALTARTPTSREKLNASVSAAMLAAMPDGLCAASAITVGLRRSDLQPAG